MDAKVFRRRRVRIANAFGGEPDAASNSGYCGHDGAQIFGAQAAIVQCRGDQSATGAR